MQTAFKVTPLIGGGYLVEGADFNGQGKSTVLHSESWSAVVAARKQEEAHAEFDKAVAKFFKPLIRAADEADAKINNDTLWAEVHFGEDIDQQRAQTIVLDGAGVILRILDEGRTDLLRWVGDALVAVLEP